MMKKSRMVGSNTLPVDGEGAGGGERWHSLPLPEGAVSSPRTLAEGETAEGQRGRERKRDLATIHSTAKALGMDDVTYRAFLRGLTGKESSGAMDKTERWGVIQELRKLAALSPRPNVGAPLAAPRRSRKPGPFITNPDKGPMILKVFKLLRLAGRYEDYADAVAQQMFGVDRFKWLTPMQMHKLVAALEIDKRRGNNR